MREYTVKEVAELVGKHEETIKRWIRSGKFPHSYRNSDKEGWRITESDLINLNIVSPIEISEQKNDGMNSDGIKTELVKDETELGADETELVKLAYQVVTLTSPTDEILSILSVVGIKRTLEILLIMQQSATKVKNSDGFIRKAIREGWSPTTIPIKLPKKQSKRLYELTQQDYEQRVAKVENSSSGKPPFYNWLED